MFAVRSSWLFFLIEFLIIFVGDRMVIGRVPGHRPIQGYWNPIKFPSDDSLYTNLAENEIPNRVGFADYGSMNRQPEPSADFVFPDEVFVPPVPERLNEIFSAHDGVPTGNVDKYFQKVLRKEETPEYVDHFINLVPTSIPKIDGRLFQFPTKNCPKGQRMDSRGKCRDVLRRR